MKTANIFRILAVWAALCLPALGASLTVDRIDGVTASVAIKAPVRAASTANVSSLSGAQTIDGVALVAEDRILLKNQTTASQNGIWVVKSTAWERSKDFDGNRDVVQGTVVMVVSGTVNQNTYWRVSAANPVTIGTTSLTFERAMGSDSALLSYTQAGSSVTRTVQDRLREAVYVRDFVTGGSGTSGDPWTGWCSGVNAIAWARGGTYYFSDGWYSCGVTLNWRLGGAMFQGQSARGTVIKHTGTGNIVELDGGLTNTVGLDGTQQQIRDMRFVGNVNTTNCIYVRNTHHFAIHNVRCNDFSNAGIIAYFSIHAIIEDFVVSPNEGLETRSACVNGIRLIGDLTWGFTGSWTIINPITGGCSGYGIEIGEVTATNNVIMNGASESNTAGCIHMFARGESNKIIGLYCNNDALDNGSTNQWHGLTGGGSFKVTTGAMSTVYGGLFDNIIVGASARDIGFYGVTYGYSGGTFTNSGTRTEKWGVKTYNVSASTYDLNLIRGGVSVAGTVIANKIHGAGTGMAMGACGTSPSVVGADTDMLITVGTGGSATSCAVTFGTAWSSAPICVAQNNTDRVAYSMATTTTTATITATAAFTASSKFHLICIGY